MIYENRMKELDADNDTKLIRCIISFYKQFKQEHLLKWIDNHMEYWKALCETPPWAISPEYAETVMRELSESNNEELQIIWLYKCRDKLDLGGRSFYKTF